MHQHSKNLRIDPSPDPREGSKGQYSIFSEYSHVAFKIEGNYKCNNMQAHILSLHAPSIPGVGSKVKSFFLKVVMLHIKLIGMEQRTPCKTHPRPLW